MIYTDIVTCANAWQILKRLGIDNPESVTASNLLDRLLTEGLLQEFVRVITHGEIDADTLPQLKDVTAVITSFFAAVAEALPAVPGATAMMSRLKTPSSSWSPTSEDSGSSRLTGSSQEQQLNSVTS